MNISTGNTEVKYASAICCLYFAILAIFISCLGLLGLASYSTFQRTAKLVLRKVMGASVFRYCTFIVERIFDVIAGSLHHCIACCLVGNA
jgi:hypothetical protein